MRSLGVVVMVALLTGCGGTSVEESLDEAAEAVSSEVSAGTDRTCESGQAELIEVGVDELSANHIEPPASYPQCPAIGGDHFAFWQNCGFYTVPVIEGAAVHSLEHGAVWITYNSSLVSVDELSELEAMAASNDKLLISPFDHDEKLVLSAWGIQQRTSASPTDDVVAEFVATWVDNPDLPEAGVTCRSAVGIPPLDVISFEGGEEQVPEEFRQ